MRFSRYIGIDYSGAKTPESSLKGLWVYMATPVSEAQQVAPPPGPKKYWSRRGVAEWLRVRLSESEPTIVGIDHAFSFPEKYFEKYELTNDWYTFLQDFQRHWPTDEKGVYVEFVRDGAVGSASARQGSAKWRRLADKRAGGAKSVFHFDVPGSVAKSTHAGLPWLLWLHGQLDGAIHFWPFDGWSIENDRSVIVEAYPSLWNRGFPKDGRTDDQHDAYSVAEWLRSTDAIGKLDHFFEPSLADEERCVAKLEGWILGVR
jgi:hypothetical protein